MVESPKALQLIEISPFQDWPFVQHMFDTYGWPANLHRSPMSLIFDSAELQQRFENGVAVVGRPRTGIDVGVAVGDHPGVRLVHGETLHAGSTYFRWVKLATTVFASLSCQPLAGDSSSLSRDMALMLFTVLFVTFTNMVEPIIYGDVAYNAGRQKNID